MPPQTPGRNTKLRRGGVKKFGTAQIPAPGTDHGSGSSSAKCSGSGGRALRGAGNPWESGSPRVTGGDG